MISQSISAELASFFDEFRFRDLEFDELLTSFRRVLTHPGEAIARVVLIGPPGSGKTFIAQSFQERIQNGRIINEENNIKLQCIMVDCKNHKSTKTVVLEIIHHIDPYFYANIEECQTAELQYILADTLQARKEALIIIFDNIDALVEIEPEEVNSLIYGFQRFSEGKTKDEPNLFSSILVAHDLEFLIELDRSVFRKIATDVIPFEQYSADQTFQLLNDYIKKNIRKKITEETIWFIAMLSEGNMHRAIEIVNKANDLTLQKQSLVILPEFVRMVNNKITDFHITKVMIDELPISEKLMLLTIGRRFRNSTKAFLNFLELPSLFISLCEEYNQLQIAKGFSEALNNLERMAIISLHTIKKEIILMLSDIPANTLVSYLEKDLKQKRRDNQFFL
ncbi:MAG: AAA family ATPase [Asgard group archaeon]|nr:AAA family ATPase [Asgard group archaeon]